MNDVKIGVLLIAAYKLLVTLITAFLGIGALCVAIPAVLSDPGTPDSDKWIAVSAIGLGALMFWVIAALHLGAGLGLLRGRRWGWVLGIMMGVLHLFFFPIGTVIGGVILYYLLRGDVRTAFDAKAKRSLHPQGKEDYFEAEA